MNCATGETMKIAYSTYALQTIDPLEAVRGVHEIGYDGLELNVGDDWPTAAARMDADARQRLREAFQNAGFPSPVLMHLTNLCAPGEDTAAKSRDLAATCQLGIDLRVDDATPIVTTTLGSHGVDWEACRDQVAADLRPYAEIAADHGAIIAVEAHVGQEFNSPEKAVWLVEALDHDSVRLNFDQSHFHVLGMDLQHCVNLCAPWSVHTHLKDGYRDHAGKVHFQLPGDGSLDLDEYFGAVSAAGVQLPITAEVTGQIWTRENYDPWATARHCYVAMRQAADNLADHGQTTI
jgi:sugar phosphate isomerase/epimerase